MAGGLGLDEGLVVAVEYGGYLALRLHGPGISCPLHEAEPLVGVALAVSIDPKGSGRADGVHGGIARIVVVAAHGSLVGINLSAGPIAKLQAISLVAHGDYLAVSAIEHVGYLAEQILRHFGIARVVASSYDDALLGVDLEVAAVFLFGNGSDHAAVVALNQLLRRASPVNLRAGIEPDLKHVADDLFLQGHSRGRSYVGAKAILERGIAGVGWEELDLDRRAFFRGQTVDAPIERLSAGIGELATQRGVRAVSRAQLPVVEELDGIDGIHAARFQELGVDVPEMPHAQNGEVRFGLGFNGDYLGARFCRRSEGGAAGVAEPDNEDVAIDSFGDVGLGDWGRRLSPACARDVVRRAFISVVGGTSEAVVVLLGEHPAMPAAARLAAPKPAPLRKQRRLCFSRSRDSLQRVR